MVPSRFRPFPALAAILGALALLVASCPPVHGATSADARSDFEQRRSALAQLAGVATATPAARKAGAGPVLFAAGFEAIATDCTLDSDGDLLPDCAETDTGTYLGIHDTGTDPLQADTDGDGLSDGDEVFGTAAGLDLPALGVSPLRRDLLVEYDWFEDSSGCGPHSHAPAAAVIARVEHIFANAHIANPDGSTGINVVQDHGQGGAFTGGNAIAGHAADLPGTFDATWDAIKLENFAEQRRGYFRYVLMPHRYNGTNSSGYAEVVGDDAIVSMACSLQEDWVANTIVHELGHLLGLHHGGFEACNGKPNYNSVMNYRYQFNGIDATCTAGSSNDADLSSGQRLVIDEHAVDEHSGVCGAPAIDWNGDGTLQAALQLDLNPDHADTCGAALRTLEDFDDWSNVTFLGLLDAHTKLSGIQLETGCGGAPVPGTKH